MKEENFVDYKLDSNIWLNFEFNLKDLATILPLTSSSSTEIVRGKIYILMQPAGRTEHVIIMNEWPL
jgi:hypothetical protein